MITRIVKMTFNPEKLDEFQSFFQKSKPEIEKFEGCHQVNLMRNVNESHVIYTISLWESEEFLNKYRNSEFFNRTWKYTKSLFIDRAEAFTLEKIG